jgi:hypothetical protein
MSKGSGEAGDGGEVVAAGSAQRRIDGEAMEGREK